jgi:protein-S-isoprenylcysteine O-methyltransferase Ste14
MNDELMRWPPTSSHDTRDVSFGESHWIAFKTIAQTMYHTILVAGQFLFSAVLVMGATWSPFPWLMILLACPGIGLAIWAWLTMGIRRLRVHPSATARTRLVRHGPYAIVRHPMYAGLLWFTAALLPIPFVWWRIASWFGLTFVLIAKTLEEEKAMSFRFPNYTQYREEVGGLLPRFPIKTKSS